MEEKKKAPMGGREVLDRVILTSASHHEEDQEDNSEDEDNSDDNDDNDSPDGESTAVLVVDALSVEGVGEGAGARERLLVLRGTVVLGARIGGGVGDEVARVLSEAVHEVDGFSGARFVVGGANAESGSSDGGAVADGQSGAVGGAGALLGRGVDRNTGHVEGVSSANVAFRAKELHTGLSLSLGSDGHAGLGGVGELGD
jgi:hypothetical protein